MAARDGIFGGWPKQLRSEELEGALLQGGGLIVKHSRDTWQITV